MRMKLAAAIAVAALSMGSAAFAADTPAAAPAAAAAKPSVETTMIGDLVAVPATKAVVDKYLPGIETNPYWEQVKQMSLRALSAYPQAQLDDTKLKAMQAELDAAK